LTFVTSTCLCDTSNNTSDIISKRTGTRNRQHNGQTRWWRRRYWQWRLRLWRW